MMGQHDRSEALFYYFRLEDQVPETHLLRLIEKHVSFAFVREKLKDSYSETGRPSIDPELLLRIVLIGYLYGITSERKLVEELRMHLAWRWFTGLGFDQEIPHHSTFSKNRHGRFQESKLFEQLFEQIVNQCVEVGLVRGKHLSVDGSFVEANAAKESRIPREQLAEAAQVHHTVRQYLVDLEQQNPVEEPVHQQDQVSTTDPDSTYATKGGTPARLAHGRTRPATRTEVGEHATVCEGTAGKKEGGSPVRGTQESNRIATPASAEITVCAGAVLPGGGCPEPQATGPLPQPIDNIHCGSLLAEARTKNSAAAIIAAEKTFRSRPFSTPTPGYVNNQVLQSEPATTQVEMGSLQFVIPRVWELTFRLNSHATYCQS